MKVPPGLMLAVVLWWGWQCDLLGWAIPCGLLLEGARRLRIRWDLQADDFRRLWNVTVLLFAGAALYLFFAQEGWSAPAELLRDPARRLSAMNSATLATRQFIQWLPLLFLPFMLAHAVSGMGRLPWTTVSVLARQRGARRQTPWTHAGFHPAHPYLVVVLFAASASDRHPNLYLAALVVWVGWALWPQRSQRFRPAVWFGCLALAAAFAFAGQQALFHLYRRVEELESQWLSRLGSNAFDANGSSLELGALGRRKLSGRIVLRVRGEGTPPPQLLREAVYTHLQSRRWMARRREFQPVIPQPDSETWRLGKVKGPREYATIQRYSRQGYTPLALPEDVGEILGLAAGAVETNRLTAARAEGLQALASYTVAHGRGGGFDTASDEEDLGLSTLQTADRTAVDRVVADLGLAGLDAKEVLKRTQDFFLKHFSYSLVAGPQVDPNATHTSALAEFLLRGRQGHCEYFATATTLLLRAAGVPARYVVGWSVQEPQGTGFVVRERHAHAWCLAYVDGRWQTVDNTPASWAQDESQQRSWWEPVYDRFSAGWLWFTAFRQGDSQWRLYVFVAGAGILAFMGWRELRGGRWRRTGRAPAGHPTRTQGAGSDSEFYAVLALLERRFTARPATHPLRPWLNTLPVDGHRQDLDRLVQLHYRLRFDPDGLDAASRQELRERARAFSLDRNKAGP